MCCGNQMQGWYSILGFSWTDTFLVKSRKAHRKGKDNTAYFKGGSSYFNFKS